MAVEKILDLVKVKHFEWVSPVVYAIWAAFLLKHSFYEVIHFDLFDHDVWFIICWSGKWNSASKVTIQGNCPLTFTFPFCYDALHVFNFSFVKYMHLGEKCVWFFSASVNILSTEEVHFLLEMWNVVSRLQFFGFSFVFQCCFVNSTVNYTGLYHLFPQRHPQKKKRQAEWRRISMWMTLHIL